MKNLLRQWFTKPDVIFTVTRDAELQAVLAASRYVTRGRIAVKLGNSVYHVEPMELGPVDLLSMKPAASQRVPHGSKEPIIRSAPQNQRSKYGAESFPSSWFASMDRRRESESFDVAPPKPVEESVESKPPTDFDG
jgi:hypothetical protein